MSTTAPTSKTELVKRAAQVAGHVAWEKLSRFEAVSRSDIPAGSRSVTNDWLTAVLCDTCPGARVVDFRIVHASAGTSTRCGIEVTYNAAGESTGLPNRVFIKLTTSFPQRLILGAANTIGGEIGFYSTIRQNLDIETPRSYFAAIDESSWRSVVVLEDITVNRGAKFSAPTTQVTIENMQDLIGDMASFHGRYWNDPSLENHPDWLKTPQAHLDHIARFIGMRKRSEVGFKRAESVRPGALDGRYDDLWTGLERSLGLASRGPQTFLHGDAHVGNTYTTSSGRMGFTDWQVIVRGLWAYDLAYIMTTALTVEVRRTHEAALIRHYLDRLAATGVQAPGFDEAWLAYRQQAFYPCFAWLLTIGRGALQPRMQTDATSLALLERTFNAIVDLKSLEAIGL